MKECTSLGIDLYTRGFYYYFYISPRGASYSLKKVGQPRRKVTKNNVNLNNFWPQSSFWGQFCIMQKPHRSASGYLFHTKGGSKKASASCLSMPQYINLPTFCGQLLFIYIVIISLSLLSYRSARAFHFLIRSFATFYTHTHTRIT